MELRFWGTRGSIPAPVPPAQREAQLQQVLARYQAAGAPADLTAFMAALPQGLRAGYGGDTCCVELRLPGQETLIIDAGSGLRRLGLEMAARQQAPQKIHLLLSHFHWDHIQGLPFFVPAYMPGNEIHVYTPQPSAEATIRRQMNPHNFPVDLDYMRGQWIFHQMAAETAYEIAGYHLESRFNEHPGGAWSFSVQRDGRKVVYASDCEYTDMTAERLAGFVAFFQDAGALVFDAQYALDEAMGAKYQWGHSTASVGLDLAARAGVKRLLCYHHDPVNSDQKLDEMLDTARYYQDNAWPPQARCALIFAHDGLVVRL